MRYEWDESKDRSNQRKHDGISFELAALALEDECCLIGPDRIDDKRENGADAQSARLKLRPGIALVLLVVHTYREDYHGEETIRIISARAAEKREIRRYREQAMD